LFTHPGGVIGRPFPFEWVTLPPGPAPDDWSWPVESLGPFADAPDDAPEIPWVAEVPDDAPEIPRVAEEPEEDPVEAVVGDEAVVVVDGLVPKSVDGEAAVVVVDAAVVELPEEGAVVVAEPSPGAKAAGAEVVPTGEAGAPAPGALGAFTATGFTEEDVAAFEGGTTVLAATSGGAPAGAAAATPGCAPGWVAPTRGSATPDTNG
jgi:hypothetical protein